MTSTPQRRHISAIVLGWQAIRHKNIDFRHLRDFDRRGARELAAVGDEDDFAGVFDDRARNLDLVDVEIQQSAIRIDGRRADDRHVGAELLDLLHRDCADDPAVALPDDPASDDHLDRLVAIQLVGDMKIIGNDQQVRSGRKGPWRPPPWWCRC